MTEKQFTTEDYQRLDSILRSGDITASTRKELETYALMLVRPAAYSHFGTNYFGESREIIRLLILVRMSEESNAEATRISTTALRVATFALFLAGCQIGMSLLNRFSPPECQEPHQTQIEKETFASQTPQLLKPTRSLTQNLPVDKVQDLTKNK